MRPAVESRRPAVELLAPAGGPPALQAALSAGADAVYLGLDRWSARAFAGNFDPMALLAAIDRAHLFGARVYLALNVLLKDDELEPALDALAEPYRAGLDALIVTDLGLAALAREAYPARAARQHTARHALERPACAPRRPGLRARHPGARTEPR